jgi:hypothetical protein
MLVRVKKNKKVKFPCNLCTDDHLNHQCPRLEEAQNLLEQHQPVVLTNPFSQGKNMAQASSSTNAPGGNHGTPMPNSNNGARNIYMMTSYAHLQTRAHDYRLSKSVEKGKEDSNPLPTLHIENIVGETITHIHNSAFKKASHNLNARVVENYSIMEDLAQTPCVMSTMEVLQSFPSQRKEFLSSLGVVDIANMGMICFYPTDNKPHLPHHVNF